MDERGEESLRGIALLPLKSTLLRMRGKRCPAMPFQTRPVVTAGWKDICRRVRGGYTVGCAGRQCRTRTRTPLAGRTDPLGTE